MKTAKTKHKIRTLAVSITACIALILSAVFSLGLFGGKYKAADETSVPDTNEVGLRFVQVAAGEDFAIGLTYEGDLYGWSLRTEGYGLGTDASSGATSLGRFYTTTPTKINVTYKKIHRDGLSQDIQYSDDTGRKIIQITATRTTAAFITDNGCIYTWGRDENKDIEGGAYTNTSFGETVSDYHYLLLRRPGTSSNQGRWYTPYIIDYNYYDKNEPLSAVLFANNSSDSAVYSNFSIAGGENNYIFVYYNGQKYCSYVWGSMMYANVQALGFGHNEGYNFIKIDQSTQGYNIDDGSGYRLVYQTLLEGSSNVTAVAGGYNVAINGRTANSGTTSLMLRGKNFITTQGLTDGSSDVYSSAVTVATPNNNSSNIIYEPNSSTSYTIQNGIIGGYQGSQDGGIITQASDSEGYYGIQSSYDTTVTPTPTTIPTTYTVAQPGSGEDTGSGIYDASGKKIDAKTVGTSVTYKVTVKRNAVSLGNDIGYGISGGRLYAWGDNSCGQNGRTAADNSADGTTDFSSYPVQTLKNKTVLSVAAGRQLSKSALAFNSTGTLTSSSSAGFDAEFDDTVKNEDAYITGAIVQNGTDDSAGDLWVWSDKSEPKKITLGVENSYNKFVAVYSGYEHNLFAITKLGKIVRVSYDIDNNVYTTELYDNFVADGQAITNWRVVADNANIVTVAGLPVDSNPDTKLATFTLYVNNGTSNMVTTMFNDTKAGEDNGATYYSGARGSLVTENKIGDVYRILSSDDDAGKAYRMLGTSTLDGTALKPRFYFKAKGSSNSVAMSPDQLDNMLDCKFVYNADFGSGIEISPKQSSKQGTVTVKFYVARYDCADNFKGFGATDDKAQYYDYKECSVDFVINNSVAFKTFNAFRSDIDNTNSYIPLLDPNNKYNNKYSIAVQNISDGVVAFADFLKGGTNSSELLGLINTAMIEKDGGYPDVKKVDAGNLEYYLGQAEANRAYSGKYQWLFTDIDADIIDIERLVPDLKGGALRDSVTADAVKVIISLTNLGSQNIHKSVTDKLFTDFNNTYGIYDVKFTYDNTNPDDPDPVVTALSFTYNILTFTASNTTGRLTYKEPAVDSYQTTNIDANARIEFNINTYYEYTKYSTDYKTDLSATDDSKVRGTWSGAASAFSQASVRLKEKDRFDHSLLLKDDDNNDVVAYGDAAAKKNIVEIVDNTPFPVGTTKTLYLTDYIAQAGSYIFFSYNDSVVNYDDFNKEFPDILGSKTDTYIKLTENSITIKPTRAYGIDFTVAIQRFFGTTSTKFNNGDEKVELHFSFTNITPVAIDYAMGVTGGRATYAISRDSIIDIWGQGDLGTPDAINSAQLINLLSSYASAVKLERLISSNDKVVDVTKINEHSFKVMPNESGSAAVRFVVSVYDKHIPFMLTFNVSGKTTVTVSNGDYRTLALSGTDYVYISDLKAVLTNSVGAFDDSIKDYTILYTDMGAVMPNAIYFTEWNEDTQTEGNLVETYPSYIKDITFQDYSNGKDNKSYIRIVMNDEAADMSQAYKMHVRFVDGTANYKTYEDVVANNGAVIEASFIVKSTKQIAKENGNNLVVNADCDNPRAQNANNPNSSWYMTGSNTGAKIYVPLEYLFACAGLQPDRYSIYLVSAPEGATKYINYTFDVNRVVITPLYDTPEDTVITLNVSTKGGSSDPNQTIQFSVTVKGISTTLSKQEYTTIWLVAFFASFGLLFIIFIIRMVVYWRRRAKQRALIKRNQELIKMRDRIHNRAATATREQVVKTKLKMEDPKYAKMFGEMKRDRNGDSGVTLENSDFGVADDKKSKKKKKGGKKSMAELKAELAAKKAAFAQAQSGADGGFGGAPMDGQPFGAPSYGAQPVEGVFADGGAQSYGGYGSPADGFSQSDLDGNAIIFDASDDGAQG